MPKASATHLRLSHLPKGEGATYDPAHDPSPDVYAVAWTGDTVTVRHYRHRLAAKACCSVTGTVSGADRAAATDVITPELACLQRLRLPCGIDQTDRGAQS
jgi:hypothetical protein